MTADIESVNWKPCRRARNLPEIPIDRGILQQVGAGQGRRPDAPIDDCHLSHCRRAEPMVTKAVRAKLQLFARKRAVRGGMLRETDTGEREAPPGKINANDR